MPYVPGMTDDTGDAPMGQPASPSPTGAAGAGGIPPEAYQLMALGQMHKLGRIQGAPPKPTGAKRPVGAKANLHVIKGTAR